MRTPLSCRNVLALLSLSLAARCAFAEDKQPIAPSANVEGISEYHLDNGLLVLLFPDASKKTVTVNVTYLVGSRHEGRGETGMAHLLEHMVFKGTPDHDDIWKSLEDHGARFNGSTWLDRTNYFETLPSDVEGNLEWALRMEADRMINSKITQEDLSKEFSVVRNEFEMGENSPDNVLWERMQATAYLWHNYGKSTIGSKSDIERVPASTLKVFYKKYYQPDNAMLVVAGDFKPEAAMPLIQKYFGTIPRPERKLEDTYTVEPQQDGARHVELRRNGDVAACGTLYHISAASHPDFAALDIVQNILTDQPSGRLYKALVESGMAASVSGEALGCKEPGFAVNIASVRQDSPVDPVLAKMIEVVEGLGKNPITDEELNRAKTRLLKRIELSMKDSGRIGVEMSEWVAAGDWRLFFLHRDRIEKATLDQVRQVASNYFKESNRTSGVFYPTKEPSRSDIPETPNVLALVRDYKGKAALSEGEEFEATPDNIEKRVTRKTLPGGMKLALLKKETRGDAVNAVMTFRFGSEADIKGHQTALGMIPQMMMRGTKNYSYQQINDKLDQLKATVNISPGGGMGATDGSINVTIRTDNKNLPAVIDLVQEMLKEPTFPTDQFEVVKKEALAGLEEQLSEPRALGFNSIIRRLSPYATDDVRYIPTMPESIERTKAVEIDELRKLHKDIFGASESTAVIVGDFDEKAVTEALDKGFSSWKSPKPYKRIETPFRGDVKGSEDVIQTPDKKMALVACAVNSEVRDDDPDYPALHMSNYILGASAKSRLLDRLRQKEGLSYGAGSMFMADSEDKNAVYLGMGICAAENTDKAYDALLDEFAKFVRDGVTPEELADSKASFALQIKTQLANDGAVARLINDGLYLKRTMAYYKDLYAKIDALTPPQIVKALQDHVKMDRMVKAKAGDIKGGSVD